MAVSQGASLPPRVERLVVRAHDVGLITDRIPVGTNRADAAVPLAVEGDQWLVTRRERQTRAATFTSESAAPQLAGDDRSTLYVVGRVAGRGEAGR